ncbi:hypothetical protein Nepgr_031856 [Nepenthes gracilis]|uniref:Uncharacterized protein n=1 Tax=Nepenthes gracilis TaxID=150966 RepID=A0AAD3Y5I9_NEPGR|nr:hypothetical protein Nepgr_031856 [Nepenthes gracilis]
MDYSFPVVLKSDDKGLYLLHNNRAFVRNRSQEGRPKLVTCSDTCRPTSPRPRLTKAQYLHLKRPPSPKSRGPRNNRPMRRKSKVEERSATLNGMTLVRVPKELGPRIGHPSAAADPLPLTNV